MGLMIQWTWSLTVLLFTTWWKGTLKINKTSTTRTNKVFTKLLLFIYKRTKLTLLTRLINTNIIYTRFLLLFKDRCVVVVSFSWFNTLHPWEAYTCAWRFSAKAQGSFPSPKNHSSLHDDHGAWFSRRNTQNGSSFRRHFRPLVISSNWSYASSNFSPRFGTNRIALSLLIPRSSYYNTWKIN